MIEPYDLSPARQAEISSELQTTGVITSQIFAELYKAQGSFKGGAIGIQVFRNMQETKDQFREWGFSHSGIWGNPLYAFFSPVIRFSDATVLQCTATPIDGWIRLIPTANSGAAPRYETRPPDIENPADRGWYHGQLWYGRMGKKGLAGMLESLQFWGQGPLRWWEIETHPHGGEWRDPYTNEPFHVAN